MESNLQQKYGEKGKIYGKHVDKSKQEEKKWPVNGTNDRKDYKV